MDKLSIMPWYEESTSRFTLILTPFQTVSTLFSMNGSRSYSTVRIIVGIGGCLSIVGSGVFVAGGSGSGVEVAKVVFVEVCVGSSMVG